MKRGRPQGGTLTSKNSRTVDTLLAELHSSIPTYAIWPDLVWQQPKPEGNRQGTAAERGEEDDSEKSPEGLREAMLDLWRNVKDNESRPELPAPGPELYRYRIAEDTSNRTLCDEEDEFLVRFSSLNGVKRVLEFGTGASTRAFMENDAEVFGCECDEEPLKLANEQLAPYPKVTILRYRDESGVGMEGISITADLVWINVLSDRVEITELLKNTKEHTSVVMLLADDSVIKVLMKKIQAFDLDSWEVCEAKKWIIISQNPSVSGRSLMPLA